MRVVSRQFVGKKFVARVDENFTVVNVQSRDVKRMFGGNAQTFALPDCVIGNSAVASQNFPVTVDDVTGLKCLSFGLACGDETFVIVIWHETNFLTVGLVRDGQFHFVGKTARFGFGEVAQRQKNFRQLVRRQVIQHVRLIFAKVGGTFELESPAVENNPCVMSRRKKVRVKFVRDEIEQRAEFNFAVATDTRIRSSPAQIFGDEIIFDFRTENFSEIRDVMLYSQMCANVSGVVKVLRVVEQHGHADNFKAAFNQKCRSQRAVNTSAHCHGNGIAMRNA